MRGGAGLGAAPRVVRWSAAPSLRAMPPLRRTSTARAGAFALACVLAPALHAQTGYQQPPAPIARILDAEPLPAVSVSPDRRWLLHARREALPGIAEVAAPDVKVAGLRID